MTAPTKALPVKQGPWGRNERNKTTGLFDHMAASIKWIRLKYQQNPVGIGSLEVGYVESSGQERIEKYCDNVIGTTETEVFTAPISTLAQYLIRPFYSVQLLYRLMAAICMVSDQIQLA